MRLILKDYLLQLREKDELDLLLCDLLLQMGYITDTRPKTGNRQYGVDIRAHDSKEILIAIFGILVPILFAKASMKYWMFILNLFERIWKEEKFI